MSVRDPKGRFLNASDASARSVRAIVRSDEAAELAQRALDRMFAAKTARTAAKWEKVFLAESRRADRAAQEARVYRKEARAIRAAVRREAAQRAYEEADVYYDEGWEIEIGIDY